MRINRIAAVLPLCALLLTAPAENAAAQVRKPLVVVNVASFDGVMQDVEWMFDTAGRPELTEVVRGLLANVGNLKGLDRTKPLGVMLFVEGGGLPQPAAVGYVPVTDAGALLESLTVGPLKPEKVEGQAGRWKLTGQNRTLHLRVIGNYAFVAQDPQRLEADFADPAKLAGPLSERFDVAASLNVQAIPVGAKLLLVTLAQAAADEQMVRKESETDLEYGLRKARIELAMGVFQRFVQQGKDVTLGWNVSRKRKQAELELAINATQDTALANYLRGVVGERSPFAGALQKQLPFSTSVAWKLDAQAQSVAAQSLAMARAKAVRQFFGTEPTEASAPFDAVFEALTKTVKTGQLDVFAQLRGTQPEPLVLVGGTRLDDGKSVAAALPKLLGQLEDAPEIQGVDLGVEEHRGAKVHRVRGDWKLGAEEQRLYGKNAALYVAAGEEALWFAFGGERALPVLKETMDEAAAGEDARSDSTALRLELNAAQWLGRGGNGDETGRRIARQAFAKGGDRLLMEVTATDSGLKLRLRLEEGFVRALGLSIGEGYDRQNR